MSFIKKYKWYISGFFVLIIIILSVLLLPPFLFDFNYLETLGTQQLYFSIVAFAVIWITLLLTIRQFRKSMAKPVIKVAFNKKGEQSFTLTYKNNKSTNNLPATLWLINKGNAIARYFQVDFIIPESVGKTSTYRIITRDDDNNYISSHTNNGEYPLFINRPHQPVNMGFSISSAIDKNNKCINYPKSSFTVKYRIYGDWAETQEGKLTIKLQR